MASRNPMCRKSCLLDCHQCWGSLGMSVLSSCLELWPCVPARTQGPRQRFREAPWRSLQDTFPMAGAWQSDGEAGRVCVCAQTQWGTCCKSPGLLCACVSEWAPEHTGSLCTCRASCRATFCKSRVMQGELPPFSLLLRKNSQKMFLHFLGTTEKLDLIAVLNVCPWLLKGPAGHKTTSYQFWFLPELQSVSFYAVILKLVQENTHTITYIFQLCHQYGNLNYYISHRQSFHR